VPYTGSPVANITSFDTSGGFAMSRTSGQLPAFVHVSASPILAAGTTEPYEDIEYTWDFGDPGGTEVFVDPAVWPYTSGGPAVNANTDQVGPDAVYVYRTAGTFTITLNIRARNTGGFITTSVAQTFVASTFNASGGEFWIDGTAVTDGSGTLISPFNNLLSAFLASTGGGTFTNVAWHIKRGSNFVGGPVGIGNGGRPVSGFRVDAYGTGTDPARNDTSNSYGAVQFDNNNGISITDIVVSNIRAITSGANTSARVGGIGRLMAIHLL
jgi:hypothetical protein